MDDRKNIVLIKDIRPQGPIDGNRTAHRLAESCGRADILVCQMDKHAVVQVFKKNSGVAPSTRLGRLDNRSKRDCSPQFATQAAMVGEIGWIKPRFRQNAV